MWEISLLVGTEQEKWIGTRGVPWHARHVWPSICRPSFGTYITGRICQSPIPTNKQFKGLIRVSRKVNFRNLTTSSECRVYAGKVKEYLLSVVSAAMCCQSSTHLSPLKPVISTCSQSSHWLLAIEQWTSTINISAQAWVQHGIMSREKWFSVNVWVGVMGGSTDRTSCYCAEDRHTGAAVTA